MGPGKVPQQKDLETKALAVQLDPKQDCSAAGLPASHFV